MLVLGAYVHRLRSLILGGVTRHVLAHADLPVLHASLNRTAFGNTKVRTALRD